MSVIHLLDKSVADLIAAGEVVERPASAVKELVENAIDAKADQITVEIQRGGISLIKVSDNGIGMSQEDAKKAFLKHSTSKILSKDDLFSIRTLGFRGEALCSIAAVSTVTLKTKTETADSGYMIRLKAGNVIAEEPTAYPRGTEISVEHLFENTPARFKFLKPESAETTVITTLIENLALSHPEISFRLIVNGKERIRTYGNDSLKEAVFSVFGREFSDSMIDLTFSAERGSGHNIHLSGFTGKPLFTKGNRTKQLFYVNNRYIKSPALSRALENAYRSSMLAGRFPVCVILIDIPPEDVDVNVHPGKTEVKFADESFVYDTVASAVVAALDKDRLRNEFVPKSEFLKTEPIQVNQERSAEKQQTFASVKHEPKKEPISAERQKIVAQILDTCIPKKENRPAVVDYGDWKIEVPKETLSDNIKETLKTELSESRKQPIRESMLSFSDFTAQIPEEEIKPASRKTSEKQAEPAEEKTYDLEEIPLLEEKSEIRILGEAFHTYIIAEKDKELVFIDKHALHERMNFERLKTQPKASKMLLTPIICSLDGDRYASVLKRLTLLNDMGFSAEDFGEGSVIVREIPEILGTEDVEPFLEDFAKTVTEDKKLAAAELFDRFLYDIACKASIKAGKISSKQEIEALVREYFDNEANLKYCPHGRPIFFTMDKKSIEKQFKRIV